MAAVYLAWPMSVCVVPEGVACFGQACTAGKKGRAVTQILVFDPIPSSTKKISPISISVLFFLLLKNRTVFFKQITKMWALGESPR